MEGAGAAAVFIGLFVLAGFLQWLRQQRRMMVHKERLAALEKGVELPPVEQEVRIPSWTVQGLLLLAGLVWMSIGIGTFVVMTVVINHQAAMHLEIGERVPLGLQWVALIPLLIGVSHIIVYHVGRNKP